MNIALNSFWKGRFTFGLKGRILTARNSLTYDGADFLMRSLAGAIDQPKATHIYLRYGSVVPGISDIKEATAALFRDHAGDSGTLFVPLLCPATLATTSEGVYEANEATFEYAVSVDNAIGDSTGEWASDDTFVSGGQIFAVGVVAAQSYGDRNADILIAAADIEADSLTLTAGNIHTGNYVVSMTL